MKVSGACHCGKITYEADIDPEKVGICHCTDCQTLSGSAFRTVAFTNEHGFRLITGELKEYVKVAESGNERIQSFCPNCGSPIYSTSANDPKVYSVRVGTLKQRNELIPKFQIWCQSKQEWINQISTVKSIQTQ